MTPLQQLQKVASPDLQPSPRVKGAGIKSGVVQTGKLVERVTVICNQLLVGGDQLATASQRADGDRACGPLPTNGFDHDVCILRQKELEIVGEEVRGDRNVALTLYVTHENAGDDEAKSEARCNRRRRFVEQAHQRATDDTAAGESDADCLLRLRRIDIESSERVREAWRLKIDSSALHPSGGLEVGRRYFLKLLQGSHVDPR